jgi:EAL domain-containing protein (putative c-di-GMP-specific phosphodiesterase class I)
VRIDDFGTGYSSLSYLQRLPIDGLKIDRAFLNNLEHDDKQREIVDAIIRLAHVLDLDVVAEGVERCAQLESLREMGCDNAQGHYLSPPLGASQMRAWLTRRT